MLTFLINLFIIRQTFIGHLWQSTAPDALDLKKVDWKTVLGLFWTKSLMLGEPFMVNCGPMIALYEPSRSPVSCWCPAVFIAFTQALGVCWLLTYTIYAATSGPSNSSFPYLNPS